MLTTILDRKCEEMRSRNRSEIPAEMPRPEQFFRQYMFSFLDERSQRGRLAHALLNRVREGDWTPNRTTAAALRRAGLDWCLVALPLIFQQYSGGPLINMMSMAPSQEDKKSKWKYREEYERFIGVLPFKSRFRASIKINGKDKWLGSFSTAEEAASAFDSASLARGRGGRLNFRTSTALKEAA